MENSGRTRGILVLLILLACGALSLIVRTLEPSRATPAPVQQQQVLPAATHTQSPPANPASVAPLTSPLTASLSSDATYTPVPTYTPEPTYTAVPTYTALPSSTQQLSSPTPTTEPVHTPTRAPAETPVPTETPTRVEPPTRAATETPPPTGTPTVVQPLSMDWVLVKKHCVSAAQGFLEFWLTANGGTGEYTFYRDIERLHGPSSAFGFGYQMYPGTASAVVGTFSVESGDQRVQSEFWIERLDCSHLVTPSAP